MPEATDVDVVQADLGLVPPSEGGGELVPAGGEVSPYDHEHPGPRQYVLIGMVLVVITAAEISVSYMTSLNSNVAIALLGCMAAMKFFLVCAWFMHMKMDAPFFRRLFISGLVLGSIVYGIVLFMFASTVLVR